MEEISCVRCGRDFSDYEDEELEESVIEIEDTEEFICADCFEYGLGSSPSGGRHEDLEDKYIQEGLSIDD